MVTRTESENNIFYRYSINPICFSLTVLCNLEALLIFKILMEWQSAGISSESLSSAVVLSSSLFSILDIERTTLSIS